ncbi:PadR family transcriptional regulator [Candidatus Woesearchaeota archaeon]|nr:PadR family transcriptional regulator [Candidatus Woesearchaeota archaeon]
MKKIKIINLVKFYTLLFLYKQPMCGYELIKQLEKCTGKKISASHVYPFLSLLKKNKIILIKKKGERGKKDYALTKEGRYFTKRLIDKFAQLIEFDKKIKICVSCGCKLLNGEYKEKIGNKILCFCCKYCAKNYRH